MFHSVFMDIIASQKAEGCVMFPWKLDEATLRRPGSRPDPRARNVVYTLQAVVVHLGSAHSGHYLTYRRGRDGGHGAGQWLLVSDSTVRPVPLATVMRSNPFLLIYSTTGLPAGEDRVG